MKRFINILLTTACAAALFSCTHKYAFKTTSYVIVEETNFTVKEDVGVVRIPVSVFNSDGLNGSVYFKVNDGSAVQGTDFTVEPASGVLTFSGNGTQYIEVSVIEHPGELTGALKFSIDLTSVSGDIAALGGITSTVVEIQDNDVVVDWDYLIGDWTATDDAPAPYEVSISKENETTLKIKNLGGKGFTVTGTVTFDTEANTASIVIEGGQLIYESSYGPCGIYGDENDHWVDCKATVTGSGITVGPWYCVILSGQYEGYYLTGIGGLTVLTKK